MNHMKSMKFGILAAVLAFGSCGNWLDVTSRSEVSVDDMYSTAEGYYTSATGVYINMGDASLYGGYVSLTALEPLTQQYTVSGDNETRRSWAAYEYTSETSKPIIEDIWLRMYNTIFNANLVIDKLRGETRPLFDEGVREIMLGEMLALRAYMYFDLVRMFNPAWSVDPTANNVPWKTTWDASIGERIPTERLLDLIMADLAEARDLLETRDPIVTGATSRDVYVSYDRTKRMNFYAVCALRARIALYRNDYATAYDEARVVIDSGKFRFITGEEIVQTDAYGEELRSNRIFTPELVFALDNDQITLSSRTYYESLAQDLLRSDACYEEGDVRKSAWTALNSMNNLNLIKYKRSALAADSYKYPTACTPMLKLSEMYLIVEEAILNDPTLDPAPLSWLNTFREHRGTAALEASASAEMIRTALTREYICEFKGEGQLFYYYKRLNLTRVDNGLYNGNTVELDPAVYTFPRPDDENDFGN